MKYLTIETLCAIIAYMKRSIFIIFLLTVWKNPALGEGDFCSSRSSEGLHPFWAQQYTGADLLRKKLEQQNDFTVPENLFSIWDTRIDRHGEYVSQLIAGPHLSAPIPLDKPQSYIEFSIISSEQDHSFMRCWSEDICPSYVNISMSFPLFPQERANIIDLIDRSNVSVVFSAGNYGKFVLPEKRKYAQAERGIILVGDCDIDGNPYRRSSYSPEVTVCAPSGMRVLSYNFIDNQKNFGGTSGAAPQVTAALSAFTAITGYSLNYRESKRVLSKTAIPHPRLPINSNMGAGMVNIWKMGEVAFKLQKICQRDNSCYAQHLLEEVSFIFSVNKQELLARTLDIFPKCLGGEGVKGSTLQQEELLEELRRAALLTPYDGELWSVLACINRQQCLWKHGEYYDSLAERVRKTDQEIIDDLLQNQEYEFVGRYFLPYDRVVTDGSLMRWLSRLENRNDFSATSLEKVARIITKSEGKVSFLQRIFNSINIGRKVIARQRGSDNSFLNMPGEINYTAENVPHNRVFLRMIIESQEIEGHALAWMGIRIAENAKNISEHSELLEIVINHQKIKPYSLRWISIIITENAEDIPNHEKLLSMIEERLEDF